MFFSPFSIAITSLGEERANLSAFRTFVRRERSIDLTSSDVILRDWRFLGVILVRGREALCSSKIVCCVKKHHLVYQLYVHLYKK